jgi:Spx/MgsR family transcriptional regulator
METVMIYGIPNCDTIKKTLSWFNDNQIQFTFHNYKKIGLDKKTLENWCKLIGWEILLNKKGTTWKKISAEFSEIKLSKKTAIDLMIQYNSLIKRPVITYGDKIMIGFDPEKVKVLLK